MERTVIFLDILGFRNLVSELTTAQLGEKYSYVIGSVLKAMNRPMVASGSPTSLFPNHPAEKPWCISYTFSDSIILISHDDSEMSCLSILIYALRSMQYLIASGLPIRGGIAYGEMHVDESRSVYLGKALTTAYDLEQEQNWIGVALDASVDEKFGQMFIKDPLSSLFPYYEVPLKSGPIKRLRTINWRWNLIAEDGTKALFKDNGTWPVRNKIENTLNYAKYIRDRGFAYPVDDSVVPLEIRSMYIATKPYHGSFTHGDDL